MNRGTVIVIISFISVATVAGVYWASTKDKTKRFPFSRTLKLNSIKPLDTIHTKYRSLQIAGIDREKVVLVNQWNPLDLVFIQKSTGKVENRLIKIDHQENIKFGNPRIAVYSKSFYLSDGTLPIVLKGTLQSLHADPFMENSAYFVESVPISSTSLAIRSLSQKTGGYVLGKQTVDTPFVMLRYGLLEKQIDGLFCTDGTLHYNDSLKRIIYLYFYRNQYIQADTNMHLIKRCNTIDPVDTARIIIAEVSSENKKTHSAPPLIVNKKSSTNGKWLFVHSGIMAQNDAEEIYRKSSVIDVYDLVSGQYHFSFYIKNYKDTKMTDFAIYQNTLLAIFGSDIVFFTISLN